MRFTSLVVVGASVALCATSMGATVPASADPGDRVTPPAQLLPIVSQDAYSVAAKWFGSAAVPDPEDGGASADVSAHDEGNIWQYCGRPIDTKVGTQLDVHSSVGVVIPDPDDGTQTIRVFQDLYQYSSAKKAGKALKEVRSTARKCNGKYKFGRSQHAVSSKQLTRGAAGIVFAWQSRGNGDDVWVTQTTAFRQSGRYLVASQYQIWGDATKQNSKELRDDIGFGAELSQRMADAV